MKTITLVLASVTFIVIINGCSKQDGSDYLPISDGSKYEYSVEYTTPFGAVQKGRMVVRIDGKEEINGKTFYKEVSAYSGIPGAESEINYYRKTIDGIYQISGKHKESGEFLSTPFPVEVGMAWTAPNPNGLTHLIVDGIENVELIDAKYENCLKISYEVEINSNTNTAKYAKGTFYLAKNVGLVRDIIKVNGMSFDFILEKYNK